MYDETYFILIILKQEDDAFASNLEIIDAVNGDNYESILKLNRIDHTFVGFYYCVKKDAVDANNEDSFRVGHASRIYLFVEGIDLISI